MSADAPDGLVSSRLRRGRSAACAAEVEDDAEVDAEQTPQVAKPKAKRGKRAAEGAAAEADAGAGAAKPKAKRAKRTVKGAGTAAVEDAGADAKDASKEPKVKKKRTVVIDRQSLGAEQLAAAEAEVDRLAEQEDLQLVTASTVSGYKGVKLGFGCVNKPCARPQRIEPQDSPAGEAPDRSSDWVLRSASRCADNAQIGEGGHSKSLGYFATAKEAALAYARAHAKAQQQRRASRSLPSCLGGLAATMATLAEMDALEAAEAEQGAEAAAAAEGLQLVTASSGGGFVGVKRRNDHRRGKPFEARIWSEGKSRAIGQFACAKVAALAFVRAKAAKEAAQAAGSVSGTAAVPVTAEVVTAAPGALPIAIAVPFAP